MSKSSLDLKAEGNIAFQEGRFQDSVDLYTEAFSKTSDRLQKAVLLSNRSAAQLKMGKHDSALIDAEDCAKLRPDWVKAYFRKGQVLEATGKLQDALNAYFIAKEKTDQKDSAEIGQKISVLEGKLGIKKEKEESEEELDEDNFIAKGEMNPASWSIGLSEDKQYEWLLDCYRMRLDDDYVYKGELNGLYGATADGNRDAILEDFLVFCKLAVSNKVIPSSWNWKKFLKKSLEDLPFAFEKSDAQDKYGSENVFAGLLGNGRSLRYTAEIVYGSSVQSNDYDSEYGKLMDRISGNWSTRKKKTQLFFDVGGIEIWRNLEKNLQF